MAAFSLEELSYVFLWVLSVLKHFHQLSIVPTEQTLLMWPLKDCPLWGLLNSKSALNSHMQA